MAHKKKPMLKKEMKKHIAGEEKMDKKIIKQDKKMLPKMKKGC